MVRPTREDWNLVTVHVKAECSRVKAGLERAFLGRPQWGHIIFIEEFPSRIVVRLWLNWEYFKRRGVDPDSMYHARMMDEEINEGSTIIADLLGTLRARQREKSEFYLLYELRPPTAKILDREIAVSV